MARAKVRLHVKPVGDVDDLVVALDWVARRGPDQPGVVQRALHEGGPLPIWSSLSAGPSGQADEQHAWLAETTGDATISPGPTDRSWLVESDEAGRLELAAQPSGSGLVARLIDSGIDTGPVSFSPTEPSRRGRRWRADAPDLPEVSGDGVSITSAVVDIRATKTKLEIAVDATAVPAGFAWRVALLGWPLVRWYAGRFAGQRLAGQIDQLMARPGWDTFVDAARSDRVDEGKAPWPS